LVIVGREVRYDVRPLTGAQHVFCDIERTCHPRPDTDFQRRRAIMTNFANAGELCRLVITRIDGVGSTEWLGGSVYAYGAGPNDAILVDGEHTTTVLVTHDGRQRWFKVSVEEFSPEQVSVLSLDHDVVVSLARRAGVSLPTFGLGPC
jgi:hypothetical protein